MCPTRAIVTARYALIALGVGLLMAATVLSASNGWGYGANVTVAGVFGSSYVLVGFVARRSDGFAGNLRRSFVALPVYYLTVMVLAVLAQYLRFGTLSPSWYLGIRASWLTLLGFPVGLGYVYGRARNREQRRHVLGFALGCLLVGSVIAGATWPSVWSSRLVLSLVILTADCFLVFVGSLLPYLVARLERDSGGREAGTLG